MNIAKFFKSIFFNRGLFLLERGVGGGGLLKRFAPFSYLNHSFISSLNVNACIRFIIFLKISLCFFICQELCWMRGLCISFTSTCFLFPVVGGSKKFEDWGG